MWKPTSAPRTLAQLSLSAVLALTFFASIAYAEGQPVLVTGVDDDTKKVGLVDLDSKLRQQPGAEHKRVVDIEVAKKMLNRIPEQGDVLVAAPATGEIKSLSAYTFKPTSWGQLFALAGAAALIIGIAAAFSRGRFWRFLIGKDNRYSNSQTQAALWFGA